MSKEAIKLNIGEVRKDDLEFWSSIYEEYETGEGLVQLANKYGTSYASLLKIFKYFNFYIRTKHENQLLNANRARKSNLEKYGVERISQCPSVRNKISKSHIGKSNEKETIKLNIGEVRKDNLEFWTSIYKEYEAGEGLRPLAEKYGSTHKTFLKIFNSFGFYIRTKEEDIVLSKEKVKQTNLEKYGVDWVVQNPEVREKAKQTNLEKYGTENVFACSEVKDKIKQTNLEKYGVEWNAQSNEIKQKIKLANLEKYGVESYLSTEEKQIKSKKTCLEKYGYEYASQSKQIKEKIKKTCLKRYGAVSYGASIEGKNILRIINVDKFKQRNIEILKCRGYEIISQYRGRSESKKWIKYDIKHLECGHIFEQYLYDFNAIKCPYCFPQQSSKEVELRNIVNKYCSNIENNIKIKNKEIDIFIPEKRIGIEYNGIYWHSLIQDRMYNNYHRDKSELAKIQNISLYHVWETDSIDIVESKIRNLLGYTKNKVGARKCTLYKINTDTERLFFDANHLHGYVNSLFAYGLFYKDMLIGAISFRRCSKGLEIARFASKIDWNIQGGFPKLLKESIKYIKHYFPYIDKIITYCDRDWTPIPENTAYYKNGFKFVGDSGPILKYYDLSNKKVYSRHKFQKSKLKKMFPESYSENKTANQILTENRILPFYNSGNWKFVKEI